MSIHPQPLIIVLEQAQEARDEAVMLLEGCRKALESERQKQQSLHDFRRQYETRWQGQFTRSGGVEIMRCYQEFMARLIEAETEQAKRTAHCQVAMEQRRSELIERERKVAAITQILQRREDEQALKGRRQEQRDTDEIAARVMTSSGASVLSSPCAPALSSLNRHLL